MAHNHRMQEIAEPWVNRRNEYLAQQEMLAQRSAGLMGVNYDPEEAGYDEAYGPQDRTRKALDTRLDKPSEYGIAEERMQDRKGQGEN